MKIMKNALASVATALMVVALSGCGASTTNTQGKASSAGGSSQQSSEMTETSDVPPEAASKLHLKDGDTFPTFKATNISNDETVTNDVFKKNKVTVMSFWFNGCTACVGEMPLLQELSEKYKDKGVGVMGVNAEAAYTTDGKKDAQEILSKQGVKYDNIALDPKNGGQVIEGITAFPTTMLVDQDGKLIGNPITGAIGDKLDGSELVKRIDEALAKS